MSARPSRAARLGQPQGGDTYHVAMIRIRSRTQQNRIGSLVVNPGGPGVSASGRGLSVLRERVSPAAAVTNQFDIAFRPRGVGRSNPVKCIRNSDQDEWFSQVPDPVSQASSTSCGAVSEVGEECGGSTAINW